MNINKKVIPALFLAAVVFPTLCLADGAGSQRVSIDLGAAFPTGINQFDNTARIGLMGGAQYLYSLDSHWGVGGQADFYNFGEKDSVMWPGENVRTKSDAITAELLGRYTILPDAKFVPYIQSGIGITRFHQDASGEPLNNATGTQSLQDTASVNFAYSIGLGVETNLTDHLVLGLEAVWHLFGISENTFGTPDLNVPTAALRLGWKFGQKATPAPAPVVKQAPLPVVALALTPMHASLGSGQSQQFDASVTGTNNTGVQWSLDPVVGSLSDKGAYTAPNPITAAQRVTVKATSVADSSKYATSVIDLTPPPPPEKVSIELQVLFDTAKADIKPSFDDEIKRVADFMKTYPTTQAEIEGHTDNMGPESYNIDLSQRRADAVRSYLISHFSIDASRITAKGYGPTRPIAPNDTPEGRAKNRRVVATLTAVKQ